MPSIKNRFLVTQSLKGALDVMITDADAVHQLSHVLRQKVGGEVLLLDNSGAECKAVIQSIASQSVRVRVISCAQNRAEPQRL